MFILFRVIFDIFRNVSMSGGVKAGWLIALLFPPVLPLFVNVIMQGRDMADRAVAHQRAAEADFTSYVQNAAGDAGPSSEIAKAKELLDSGTISPDEFEALSGRSPRNVRRDVQLTELRRLVLAHVSHHLRMFTARPATITTVVIDANASTSMSDLARGVSGIVSVGLNAVAFVKDR